MRAVFFDIGGILEITPDTGWRKKWDAERVVDSPELEAVWRAGSVGRMTLDEVEYRLAEIFRLDRTSLEAFMADLWAEYLGELNVELERPSDRRRTRAERTAARVARRPSTPWELGDGFAVRSFFGPGTPSLMLGEQVEAVHRPLRHLAWKADGELAFWRVPVEDQGTTDEVATLSISAAPALLGWGEIPGRGHRGAGTVALYGGAGFRAGAVRMRSDEWGNSNFRSFAGPLAMARASVSLGRFVGLALNIETGWLLHGPTRPNGIPLAFHGPWANGVIVIVSRF
jgi:hypothetical protein